MTADHPTQGGGQSPEVVALVEALTRFVGHGCPVCSGDCASANPPVYACPMKEASRALATLSRLRTGGGE